MLSIFNFVCTNSYIAWKMKSEICSEMLNISIAQCHVYLAVEAHSCKSINSVTLQAEATFYNNMINQAFIIKKNALSLLKL